eukprot:gene7584-7789_t
MPRSRQWHKPPDDGGLLLELSSIFYGQGLSIAEAVVRGGSESPIPPDMCSDPNAIPDPPPGKRMMRFWLRDTRTGGKLEFADVTALVYTLRVVLGDGNIPTRPPNTDLSTLEYVLTQVVQLPQSIHYTNKSLAAEDANIINALPTGMFHLLLREANLLDFTRHYYPNIFSFATPDAAFGLGALQAPDPVVDPHDLIIGKTGPIHLLLGKNTKRPLVVFLPDGAYVMKADANGMFSQCMDTETLKLVFAHVNPAFGHLMWYPDSAEGYFDLLNGNAVQLSASEPVWEVAVGAATAPKCAPGFGFAAQLCEQHSSQSTGQGIDETESTGGSGDQGSNSSSTGVPLVHRCEMPGAAEVSGVYTPPRVATTVVTPRLSLA